MVRAFIGIAIPEDIKRHVIDIQAQLKSLPIKAKFVEPENLHISLSFLGEITDAEIETIKLTLDDISRSYEKFEIILGNILLIPNEEFVRVIALDVESDILESVRKEIVKRIRGKNHLAHLTLARVSNVVDKQKFIEGIDNLVCRELPLRVDEICLMKSELQKSGPVYTILNKSYLK